MPVFADSQGYIGRQDHPPVFNPGGCRTKVSLVCLTSVQPRPPFTLFGAAFAAHCAFRGKALSNAGVREIRTQKDLSYGNGNLGILFGMQHAPEDLTEGSLQQLYEKGVRLMGIGMPSYGGDYTHADAPLTEAGKVLLRRMSAHGFILNLSGMGQRTMFDALTLIWSENLHLKPMASHSGCSSVFEHEQNLSDGILKGIANLHGYVGIPLSTSLLGHESRDYFKEVERHVAHAICVMGDKRVGIGSNCIHQDRTMEAAKKLFEKMTRPAGRNGSLGHLFPNCPPEIIESGSRMFEVLTAKLNLHSEVLGANLVGFLKNALRPE